MAVMDEISEETGKPLAQIALNYTVQKEFVAVALVGMTNAKQAKQNCDSYDWSLTADQMARLDTAVETYIDFDGSQPSYNRPR